MSGNLTNKSALVMFSGGLDSLSALWITLNDKSFYRVHVHHINIENIERRAAAESIAVKACLTYLFNHTNLKFDYSESTISLLQRSNKFMYDSDIVSFVAGGLCLNQRFTHVIIGMHSDDLSRNGLQDRILRSQRIFDAFGTDAIKTFPLKEMSKSQAVSILPTELRNLAWSCRTPRYVDGIPSRCNHCQSCLEVNSLDLK